MDDNYIRFLEEIINVHFNEKECELINSSSEIVEYKKSAIPVMQGDKLSHTFVIVKGLVRGFYVDENGSEITKCFSYEKSFFSCEGLISLDTASFHIECLENVLCVKIPYETVKYLMDNNSEISKAIYNIVLREFTVLEKRSKDMLLENATSRYQKFVTDHYELSKRLKQKYIASYLGISPISLSRIKKSEK